MYHPRTDVTHRYRETPADFAKHLFSTLVVIVILTTLFAVLFGEPVRPALTISHVAKTNPILFEQNALSYLNGQSSLSAYGPPYNTNGTPQSPFQRWSGVIHPLNTVQIFFMTPLQMASEVNPVLKATLKTWNSASSSQQSAWEQNYSNALGKATVSKGQVLLPSGDYGPLATMMSATLGLGRSGLMSAALDQTPADYQFNNQNSLLYLQDDPLHNEAGALALQGSQWGIIHEEKLVYPGPWWMTIVTAIYQIPFIANSPSGDALAIGSGMILFLILLAAPWIPFINRLPRYLLVHRWIWKEYYDTHKES